MTHFFNARRESRQMLDNVNGSYTSPHPTHIVYCYAFRLGVLGTDTHKTLLSREEAHSKI